MANIKSQIKDIRTSAIRRERNMAKSSEMKTRIKTAVDTARTKDGEQNLKLAIKAIDKAVKNNIIHKNTGARKKSLLMRTIEAKKSEN